MFKSKTKASLFTGFLLLIAAVVIGCPGAVVVTSDIVIVISDITLDSADGTIYSDERLGIRVLVTNIAGEQITAGGDVKYSWSDKDSAGSANVGSFSGSGSEVRWSPPADAASKGGTYVVSVKATSGESNDSADILATVIPGSRSSVGAGSGEITGWLLDGDVAPPTPISAATVMANTGQWSTTDATGYFNIKGVPAAATNRIWLTVTGSGKTAGTYGFSQSLMDLAINTDLGKVHVFTPVKVQNVKAQVTQVGRIDLDWDDVDNNTWYKAYNVWYRTTLGGTVSLVDPDGDGYTVLGSGTPPTTPVSAHNHDLASGSGTIFYKVGAVTAGSLEGTASEEVSEQLIRAQTPQNLTATQSESSGNIGTVDLYWDNVASPNLYSGYRVYQSQGSDPFEEIANILFSGSPPFNQTMVAKLVPGQTYNFQVTSHGSDESAPSTSASVTIFDPGLANPTITSIQSRSVNTVELKWTPVATGAKATFFHSDAYRVYRRAKGSTGVLKDLNANLSVDKTGYKDTTAINSVTYEYVVTSVLNNDTESDKAAATPTEATAIAPLQVVGSAVTFGTAAGDVSDIANAGTEATDAHSFIYAIDKTDNMIYKIDLDDGGIEKTFNPPPSSPALTMSSPSSVTTPATTVVSAIGADVASSGVWIVDSANSVMAMVTIGATDVTTTVTNVIRWPTTSDSTAIESDPVIVDVVSPGVALLALDDVNDNVYFYTSNISTAFTVLELLAGNYDSMVYTGTPNILWISDTTANKVYLYDLTGTLLNSYDIPAGSTGIAFNIDINGNDARYVTDHADTGKTVFHGFVSGAANVTEIHGPNAGD